MVIVYYVNTYYLDAAIQTLESLKKIGQVHLLIEISPESRISNIVEVNKLEGHQTFEKPGLMLGEENWQLLKPYFEGMASVQFVAYRVKRSFSVNSFGVAYRCAKKIRELKPDVIHFDSISPRILGMVPWLAGKKIFITVHDPLPHTGEGSWKIRLSEYIFFRMARGLFFYSRFARDQFAMHHRGVSARRNLIRFQPFRFIQQFAAGNSRPGSTILFFGRILPYKGVDLLLEAIPAVIKKFPDQVFTIAGESVNYSLDNEILNTCKKNIRLINSYISTAELAKLIQEAKFVVCPYRDATQSGVLMTAYALGKMVAGTNLGAFPEYIIDGINGVLMEPDPVSIADKLISILTDNKFAELEKNIESSSSALVNQANQESLLTGYETGLV